MSDLTSSAHVATAGSSPGGETQWIRSAADVSRLVNSGDSARNNARIVVAIALGGVFLDAYDLGALAFGIKDITREFSLTPTGTGMVASAITFGAIIGALIGGYLTDKIGRYRVFMADMFFFVVAAIACAFAPNESVLAGARFVMGLGVGICRWRWHSWRSFLSCAARGIKPPASRCGVRPGTRQSVSRICWCCCFMRCCLKATPTGSGG